MPKHPLGPWTSTETNATLVAPAALVYEFQKFPNGTIIQSVVGASPQLVTRETETKSGVNNGKPIPQPSPATLEKVTWKQGSGYAYKTKEWSQFGRQFYLTCEGGHYTPSFANLGELSKQTIQDKSFNKFINKQGSPFQAIPFVGQFKSFKNDLRFIEGSIRGRHNEAYKLLVKNLVKNRKGSIKDLSAIVSDHWLRYQFGIKPDISDMESLLEGIRVLDKDPKKVKRMAASHMEREVASVSGTFNDGRVLITTIEKLSRKVLVKTGASLRTDYVDKQSKFARAFGFGLEDFVPSGYELLPWSWLVDYFTNVGDFINLLALRRGKWENGWVVVIDEKIHEAETIPTKLLYQSTGFASSSSGKIRRKTFSFSRQPVSLDTYVPEFRFEVPDLRQAANIVAVGAGLLIKPQQASRLLRRQDLGGDWVVRG